MCVLSNILKCEKKKATADHLEEGFCFFFQLFWGEGTVKFKQSF